MPSRVIQLVVFLFSVSSSHGYARSGRRRGSGWPKCALGLRQGFGSNSFSCKCEEIMVIGIHDNTNHPPSRENPSKAPAAHQQHASKRQQQRTSNAPATCSSSAPASAPATHQRHISKCRCTSDTAHARAVPEFLNFCKRPARRLWCRWCFSAAVGPF